MTRTGWLDWAWWLAFAVGSSAWCLTAAEHLGPTFDELHFTRLGLEGWRTGSPFLNMDDGVMPLPMDLQTLPAYWHEQSTGVRYDVAADLPHLLRVGRATNQLFWWLLLAYALMWGRWLGGTWGGRLGVAVVACEPNLLAHASLATTDIALTATVLAATYHFAVARDRGWPVRVLLPGLLYGVALAAKASALAYVPFIWLVSGMYHLREQGGWPGWAGGVWATFQAWRRATWRLRWDVFIGFWIAFAWVLVYTGTDWKPEPQFSRWANSLEPGPGKDALVWLADTGLSCFPNAAEGLARQIKHGWKGHDSAFVYGRRYDAAVWYYFPAALAIKLTDAVLLAVLVAAAVRPRGWRHPGTWIAAALLAFCLTTKVQIGVRIVFPLVVFLHLSLVAAAVRPLGVAPDRRRWITTAMVAAVAVYAAASAARMWPDGLGYANQLHGGPTRVGELLSDSNVDWGQGLPELREWWAANGEPPLHVWYCGCDPTQNHPPFTPLPLQTMPDSSPATVRERVAAGYFAVSVSLLNGCIDRRPQTVQTVEWLKSLTPVARTRTMRIYRFP